MVGVVVVDDNPDGRAREVVDSFATSFDGGIRYRQLGEGNISLVRNAAIEEALALGADWIAMTDDDCVPTERWLSAYLDAVSRTGASAFTSTCHLAAPDGAPSWLTDEPFLTHGTWHFEDDQMVPTGATNNSFLDAGWLREHDDVRFDERLGVVGGEDMVFYRSAVRHGLDVRFVADAVVVGHEPASRATFHHQLRAALWTGNTRHVTEETLGDTTRPRSFARGGMDIARGLVRSLTRLLRGRPPQLRFALARCAEGLGLVLGAAGVRIKHH